jgi:L-ribulose-5-phosphate 3-epimerase
MFDLGIISDEVSDDVKESCGLIGQWGLRYVELRSLWGRNILELSEEEVARAQDIIEEHGLKVSAIASPVFKSSLSGQAGDVRADYALGGSDDFGEQLRLLGHACKLCRRFGTNKVRVFSFYRESWNEALVERIASRLIEAAEVARAHDALLVVENEPVCNVRTGRETGELFAAIDATAPQNLLEHLAILWDPGNALFSGERSPYPEGYRALDSGRIGHVHLKDVRLEGDEPGGVPLGEGRVDYVGQLRALAEDGYGGPLVLEPHYRPAGMSKEEAASACVEAARQVLKQAFYRT